VTRGTASAYDAGNFGMQCRRVHGVMADASFNPRALMDDEPIEYTKAMEVTRHDPRAARGAAGRAAGRAGRLSFEAVSSNPSRFQCRRMA
jgi:hypothetical protein